MRNGEEWNNKGLTKKQGWCRPVEKLVKGTKPWGKRWPNGELNPTPRRVIAREAQGSGAERFSICDETAHYSMCQDEESDQQQDAGSNKRKKWAQLGHGRYKKMAMRERGNPGAPWGHPNHRWARKDDGPTLDAVEAAVINRELNRDFKLDRSKGKRTRADARPLERQTRRQTEMPRDDPRDEEGRRQGAGFEEADREVGAQGDRHSNEPMAESEQNPAEGTSGVNQRVDKRRRVETVDDAEARCLNAR